MGCKGVWARNNSRASRFARLRATAFPILALAAMPRRGASRPFGRAKQVMNRPRSLTPPSNTLVNSARRRNLSVLPLRRDREALAPFGAAALQHDATVLGMHAPQEAVGLAPAAPVGLERTFHRKSL